MNKVYKGAALVLALLAVLAVAGCTQETEKPQYQSAYIFDEYAKIVDTTHCRVDGDPTSDALTRIEIKASSAKNTDAVYADLKTEYGLGLPALCDEYDNCIVFTADKVPVIKVMDWEQIYYVIPAQSEEDARHTFEIFMRAYAESMGIGEE